jgi:hypothetical protein
MQTLERRVVRQIQVASAARVAFALSLTLGAVVLVGLIALFLLAKASGAISPVEEVVGGLFGDFRFNLVSIVFSTVLFSAVAAAMAAALAAITAVLYNALSDLVGGLEVVTRERS